MPTVRIPTTLRSYADGQASVQASGATLAEVLADITQRYPQLHDRLLKPDGRISSAVHVFINEHDLRTLGGIDATVAEDDTVAIVPAMAGGSGAGQPPLSQLR